MASKRFSELSFQLTTSRGGLGWVRGKTKTDVKSRRRKSKMRGMRKTREDMSPKRMKRTGEEDSSLSVPMNPLSNEGLLAIMTAGTAGAFRYLEVSHLIPALDLRLTFSSLLSGAGH
jgi:hypothetical protein